MLLVFLSASKNTCFHCGVFWFAEVYGMIVLLIFNNTSGKGVLSQTGPVCVQT